MTIFAAGPDLGDFLLHHLILPCLGALLVCFLLIGIFETVRKRLARSRLPAALRDRVAAIKASRSFAVGIALCQLAIPFLVCLGAFRLKALAWHRGYSQPEIGFLVGSHALSFPILLIAWLSVSSEFVGEASKTMSSGVKVSTAMVLFLTVPGCCGCYSLWPVVLALLAFLVTAMAFNRKAVSGPGWQLVVPRVGFFVLVYMLTWYQCATMKGEALRGFGERIEAKVGANELLAWAAEVITAHKQREQAAPLFGATALGLAASPLGDGPMVAVPVLFSGPTGAQPARLTPEEVPEFVHDLMGRRPQSTHVLVYFKAADPYVTISNSSQEAFQITARPSRIFHAQGSFPPWFPEAAGLQWRPGLYLDTAGNFR